MTGKTDLSPAAPRAPSLPPTQLPQGLVAGDGWKWRHGVERWEKQEATKGWQAFPLPLALSHHPCWDPPMSFPRAGQAQNAPA